jgi:formiminotetrahydrofolate cyclodeaminase
MEIQEFLPHCNPNITSDAKVGIHQLAGASRAAFQTAIVNSPSDDEKARLKQLLMEIRRVEDTVLDLD